MILLAVAAALQSCDKPFELSLPLAVTSNRIDLEQYSGSTHVLVYSTGRWTAALDKEVDWLSLNKVTGVGNNDLVVTFSENYSAARQVGLVISTAELKDTISIVQAGPVTEPSYAFLSSTVNLAFSPSTFTIPVTTNLRYGAEAMKVSVNYLDEESGWVKDVTCSGKGVNLTVKENKSGWSRSASLDLFFKDETGKYKDFRATVKLVQTMDAPKVKLSTNRGVYEAAAASCTVPTTVNTLWPYFDLVEVSMSNMDEENPWIRDIVLTQSGLKFSLSANDGSSARKSKITLYYEDKEGNTANASFEVNQNPA